MLQNEYEIYLSYDAKDDLNFRNKLGWVSEFRKYLTLMMQQLTGREPLFKHISDLNTNSTAERFLFVFLSNNNLKSDKTEKEYNNFIQIIAGEDENRPDQLRSQRVFKIKKYPVPYNMEPESMRDLINYNFFGKNDDTAKIDLYKPFDGQNNVNKVYWYKLSEVAYNIYSVLQSAEQTAVHKKSSPTVYLAETGPDLMLHRLVIKRELERLNYKVLPDKNLPNTTEAVKQKIQQDLQRADLLIHLLGQFRSEEYEGEQSVAEIQASVAAEMNENKELNCARLTWLPPGLQIENNRQRMFFDSVKREMESNENCDIVQTNIEDLKSIVEQKLSKPARKKEINNVSSNDNEVYLIYDYVDKAKGEKISQQLEGMNYKVTHPEFSSDFINFREKHNKSLKRFDKAIVFCDKSNDNWLKMKLMDLLKSSGIGRDKSLLVKVVLTDNAKIKPEKLSKFKFDVYQINNEDRVSYEQWQEIMSEFNELVMVKSY